MSLNGERKPNQTSTALATARAERAGGSQAAAERLASLELLYVQPHLQRHGTTISSNPQPFKGTDKRRCCEIFAARAGMLRAEYPPEPDTEGQLVWLNFDGADSGMSEQAQFPISVPIERISRMVVATLNGIAKHRDTARASGAGPAVKH